MNMQQASVIAYDAAIRGAYSAIYDRFANDVIKQRSIAYDGLEIHGVRDVEPPGESNERVVEVDNDNPQYFSVYVHLKNGGVDCVGDFGIYHFANGYASELAQQYGWTVADYVPEAIVKAERDAWKISHGIVFKQEFGFTGDWLWRSTVNDTCWIGYHPSREAALNDAIECGAKFEGATAIKGNAEKAPSLPE